MKPPNDAFGSWVYWNKVPHAAIERVEVDVDGQFGAEGEPATNVTYQAGVVAHAAEAEIRELMQHTDTLAEIQNTLRVPTPVTLDRIEAVTVQP